MFNSILAPVLIGSWVNSYLLVVESLQAWKFFRGHPDQPRRDPLFIKALVAAVLFVDVVGSIAAYACVYLFSVSHWGQTSYLLVQYWPIHTYVMTSGVNAFFVEMYLIWRYWLMSRRFWVCLILVTSASASLVGSAVTVVYLALFPGYNQRHHLVAPVTTWLVASASADALVAVALVHQLSTFKSEFRETRSLIKRLIHRAIQTGTVTSVFAVVVLLAYLLSQDTNICVGFGFCLGRIYGCTLLFNLNTRRRSSNSVRGSFAMEKTEQSTRNMQTFASMKTATTTIEDRRATSLDLPTGIHVHRTAVIHVDNCKDTTFTTSEVSNDLDHEPGVHLTALGKNDVQQKENKPLGEDSIV